MARIALPQWMDDDDVTIPVPSKKHPDGKDYTFASPDIDTGVRLTTIAQLGVKAATGAELAESDLEGLQLDDAQEQDFYRMVMGDTYDELVADGVSWTRMQRLGRYLFLLHGLGEEAAAQAVERSSGGARPPANREQRRAAKKGATKKSTPKASRAGSTNRKAARA